MPEPWPVSQPAEFPRDCSPRAYGRRRRYERRRYDLDPSPGGMVMMGPECPPAGSVCDAACDWLTTCTVEGGCESLDQIDGPAVRALCMERCRTNEALGNVICVIIT